VESHGSIVESAGPGTRAAIAISNIAVEEVKRGDVLVDAPAWQPTSRIAARVQLDPEFEQVIRKGRLIQVHLGTASAPARVRFPFSEGAADSDYALISLKAPLVARSGDRFVIRSGAPVATAGGGVVVDPFPARGSIREAIGDQADSAKLTALLRFAGARGVALSELAVRMGISPEKSVSLVEKTTGIVKTDNFLFSGQAAQKVESALFDMLAKQEANDPLARGVSLSTARMMTRAGELFEVVVRRVCDRGEFVVEDGLIRRTSWAPSLDESAQKLADSVLHDICASAKEPPSVGELVRKRGSKVPDVLRFLHKEGRLAQVETDRYYDTVVVEELIGALRGRMKDGRVYSPGDLRDVLGVSRKYLIPFLEYCDRLGVTERRFEGRVLRGKG
jgi:selenocysteine-specific elongation factor